MKNSDILLFALVFCFVFISCDSIFYSTGVVIDKSTGQPIDSVRISIKELETAYTDSAGKYEIHKFVTGYAGDLEILFEKDGYKTKHVKFGNDKVNRMDVVIELIKSEGKPVCMDRSWVNRLFNFNRYFFPLLNLLTLIFVSVKKNIRWKIAFIFGILLLNFYVQFSYTDCHIVSINYMFGLLFPFYSPYSLSLVIPLGTTLFWGFFLFRKDLIQKKKRR